jgi:type IV secretory pathway protease TraF
MKPSRRALLAVAGLAALGVVAVRRSLIVVDVHGASMEPTYAGGSRLLAVRSAVASRGQVIVLRHRRLAESPGASAYLIKRLAALPGDPVPASVRATVGVEVVPAGQCVVLGDNTDSVDSRSWGFVPLSDVVGRVLRVMR